MTRDPDIRAVLLEHLRADPTRWVCEHASLCCRAVPDVVSCDEVLHAWEIKSGADSLARLIPPHGFQVTEYSKVFDRVTLVCDPRHARRAATLVPAWWGITIANRQADGIVLTEERQALQNPGLLVIHQAYALYTHELRPIAKRFAVPRRDKYQMVKALCERLPADSLRAEVRAAIKLRDYEAMRCERRTLHALYAARRMARAERDESATHVLPLSDGKAPDDYHADLIIWPRCEECWETDCGTNTYYGASGTATVCRDCLFELLQGRMPITAEMLRHRIQLEARRANRHTNGESQCPTTRT
ncbi:MAG TPA: sce7726 family protein [Gammaproteobacteria bacterium]|nr:sce7726 family protein [Gammaproteobacteria bacterium]